MTNRHNPPSAGNPFPTGKERNPDEERAPLDVLADDFSERLRAGQSPSIESYAAAHPELADDIRDLFPSIEMIEKLSANEQGQLSGGLRTPDAGPVPATLGDFDVVREIGRGGMGIVYEAFQRSLHRRVALKVLGSHVASSPKQLKRFQREAEAAARLHHSHIVPVFGIGESNGQHYFAMQYIEGVALSDAIRSIESSLSAVSQPQPSANEPARAEDASTSERRFTAERAAVALVRGQLRDQLQHGALRTPASAPPSGESTASRQSPAVDQTGTAPSPGSSPVPEPPPGPAPDTGPGSIADAAAGPGTRSGPHTPAGQLRIDRAYWMNVARATADIADALAYAHLHGVLHRDVKPSNILLDDSGGVWITDFGLARHEEHEGVTETGDIVGTLRYMAPEQFNGQTDARSDIYSLGMTLYELLALRPAYDEVRHGALIQKKTTAKLASPRTFNRQIPRDLETITMKACATDPADRYATAGEFAADLERFLEDRPIRARRFTPAERLWRWARRNPVVAALSTTSLALLVAVAVVSAVGNYRTGLAMKRANEERRRAVDVARIAREESHRAETNLRLAIRAFEEIIDNIASRGVPQSIEIDLDQDVVTPQPVSVLTAADASLLQQLLVFFDDFAEQNATDLKPETAEAHRRMGDIHLRLGMPGLALESYDQALTIYSALKNSDNDSATAAAHTIAEARILNARGLALVQNGSFRGAIDSHQQARRKLEDSTVALNTADGRFELAQTLNLLGSIGPRSGFRGFSLSSGISGPGGRRRRPEGERPAPADAASAANRPPAPGQPAPPTGTPAAAAAAEKAEQETGTAAGEGTDRTPAPREEAPQQTGSRTSPGRPSAGNSNSRRSETDRSEDGKPGDSSARERRIREFRQRMAQLFEQFVASSDLAIGLLNELIQSDPENVEYRLAMARCLRNRVWIDSRRNPEVARSTLDRSIALLEELVSEQPASPRLRYELADTLCLRVNSRSGNEPDAIDTERVNRAIEICEALLKAFPDYAEYQALAASALIRHGFLMRRAGNDVQADEDFHRALDLQRALASRFPTVAVYQLSLVRSLQGRGLALRSAGDLDGARKAFGEAVSILKRYAAASPGDQSIQRLLDVSSRIWKELSVSPPDKPDAT